MDHDPWKFQSLEEAQRQDIRSLSLWQRLLLHDELLANAQLVAGGRLRERRLDQRHLGHAMSSKQVPQEDHRD